MGTHPLRAADALQLGAAIVAAEEDPATLAFVNLDDLQAGAGWGARSAATVLARYEHLEHIPKLTTEWDVAMRGSLRLATTLTEQRERALLPAEVLPEEAR